MTAARFLMKICVKKAVIEDKIRKRGEIMQGDPKVDKLMIPVMEAIRRHTRNVDAFQDIYNRAYEAVKNGMDAIGAQEAERIEDGTYLDVGVSMDAKRELTDAEIEELGAQEAERKEFCPNCEKETDCTHEAELYVCNECGEDFAKYIVSRNPINSDVSVTRNVVTAHSSEKGKEVK